jgi:hypothetical protein
VIGRFDGQRCCAATKAVVVHQPHLIALRQRRLDGVVKVLRPGTAGLGLCAFDPVRCTEVVHHVAATDDQDASGPQRSQFAADGVVERWGLFILDRQLEDRYVCGGKQVMEDAPSAVIQAPVIKGKQLCTLDDGSRFSGIRRSAGRWVLHVEQGLWEPTKVMDGLWSLLHTKRRHPLCQSSFAISAPAKENAPSL